MRRGRPTRTCVYGEALAILAGDALLTEAFGVMADARVDRGAARVARRAIVAEIAARRGRGRHGRRARSLDLAAEGAPPACAHGDVRSTAARPAR